MKRFKKPDFRPPVTKFLHVIQTNLVLNKDTCAKLKNTYWSVTEFNSMRCAKICPAVNFFSRSRDKLCDRPIQFSVILTSIST